MNSEKILDEANWAYVRTFIPENIEETAREHGALVRRRNIPDAETLLRVILAYAVSNLSIKDVAAWASAMNIAGLRGPSLHNRLSNSVSWLKETLADILRSSAPTAPEGLRWKVVDATVINGPAAKGTDWRLHVVSDPVRGCLHSLELTDRFTGERLDIHDFSEGDVILGDRCYATARGIHSVRKAGAHVVVRCNPHSTRLCDSSKHLINLNDFEKHVPQAGVMKLDLLMPIPPEKRTKSHKVWQIGKAQAWLPVMLVGGRTIKGKVIWVLSTLDEQALAPVDALRAYRFRWQIELLFKRYKSLLGMDSLPSKEGGPTSEAWVLARLIAAALAHKMIDQAKFFSPWGYELRGARV